MGKDKFDRYFYVDYENVNFKGLEGIEDLGEGDCVRIYYSKSADTLPIEAHLVILESKASFKFIKVDMPIKNSMDCRILLDMSKMIKKHKKSEYIIISKDTDFDRSVSEFAAEDYSVKKVCDFTGREAPQKQPKPRKSKHAPLDEQTVKEFIDKHFEDISISGDRDENIEKTVQAVMSAKTKNQVNNALMRIYDNESVKVIYDALKPLIKDLPGK